ncbi:hypothetical protein MMC21_008038 [Puttea exsequens]|nr:hypothetical protein [Puttea exsequens]
MASSNSKVSSEGSKDGLSDQNMTVEERIFRIQFKTALEQFKLIEKAASRKGDEIEEAVKSFRHSLKNEPKKNGQKYLEDLIERLKEIVGLVEDKKLYPDGISKLRSCYLHIGNILLIAKRINALRIPSLEGELQKLR